MFRDPKGIITSPTDIDFDTSSANCTYIIRQEPGYYIKIQFSSVHFKKDVRCRNYIEVSYGFRGETTNEAMIIEPVTKVFTLCLHFLVY